MDPETGNFDGTQISDLIQECRQYVPLMHYFIFKTLNETERKIFHHTAPDNLSVVYESIQLVLGCASSLVRQYRPGDVRRQNQQAISAMTEGVSQLQLDITALARELYWDCSTRGVFAFPHSTHADLLGSDVAQGRPQSPLKARITNGISSLIASQRCTAPACLNTVADGRLRACGECTHMRYCSRTCQKRAWTNPRAPHRVLCKLLADVAAFPIDTTLSVEDDLKYSFILSQLEQLALLKLEALYPSIQLRV
jgi:hypothetical protein